jgi:hypothetical protein
VHVLNDQTVQFNLNANLGTIDEVRIFVQTPEPGAAVLLAGGLAFVFWRRRRA